MRKGIVLLMSLLSSLMIGGVPSAAAEEMSLLVLNVGKADAMLLRSGDSAYLIDTGRGRTFDTLEKALDSLNVAHLDGVIITHTDSDHVGGLKKLLIHSVTDVCGQTRVSDHRAGVRVRPQAGDLLP